MSSDGCAVGSPLLADFSLEMTGKDVDQLGAAAPRLPAGTRVHVTYLEHEDLATRVRAARACRDRGLTPVPHVSARRLASRGDLEAFLAGLAGADATERLFVVGGDPATPHGPFPDALSVLTSGLLPRFGVREAGIAGYPEGHPGIGPTALWRALLDKTAALDDQGLAGSVVTQFGFDPDAVLRWIEELRDRGVDLPVRVGVPGPAGIRRLLRYAARFGVGTSAGIVRKYGLSLNKLVGTAGPDAFLHDLAERLDPGRHGVVRTHFYTFGGLAATADWVAGADRAVRS